MFSMFSDGMIMPVQYTIEKNNNSKREYLTHYTIFNIGNKEVKIDDVEIVHECNILGLKEREKKKNKMSKCRQKHESLECFPERFFSNFFHRGEIYPHQYCIFFDLMQIDFYFERWREMLVVQ